MIKHIIHIAAVVIMLCGTVLNVYGAEYTDVEEYADLFMQESPEEAQGLYRDMRRDTMTFSYDMVTREMQERFGTTVPSFGITVDDAGQPLIRTWAEQFFSEQFMRDYYTRSLKRYLEFTDVYLMAKYGGMFANGTREDSPIDIYVDVEEIQRMIIADENIESTRVDYGGFARGMTAFAARATGVDITQSYQVVENRSTEDYTFLPSETYFGVCSIDGISQYSEDEKQAVVNSLGALPPGETQSAEATIEELLPITETVEDILEGKSVREQLCIPDSSGRPSDMCVTFQLRQTQPRLTRNAKVLSLEDATTMLHESLEQLSRQDLTARTDSNASFSLPWFDLKLRPSFQIQVRSIPVFASRRFSEVFQLDAIASLHNDWNSLLRGGRPISTTEGNAERNESVFFTVSEKSKLDATIETNQEIYKVTLPVRTRLVTEKRFVDMYGGALESFSSMLSSLSTSTQNIKTEAKALVTKLLE